uniref:trypsin n=1 Tax=Xiphophorus couchianus TaxID=32473 RepID=A0A3B5LJ22_9TELE
MIAIGHKALVVACFIPVTFNDDKIVGGYECQPHQVFLHYSYHFCGGSLVNENWTVSSAHCNFVSGIELHLGEHSIEVHKLTEQFISSSVVVPHPQYNPQTFYNDIMLMKLSRPATFNEYVQPVALPTRCAPVGVTCKVSGWLIGNKIYQNKQPQLQCVDIPVLSVVSAETHSGIINTSVFCAGYLEGGKDTCQVFKWLQGVASWGTGCSEKNYQGNFQPEKKYLN